MKKLLSLVVLLVSIMLFNCQCDDSAGGLTAVKPEPQASEEEIDFGKVLVGSTAQRELRITNKGQAELIFERAEIQLKSHKTPKPYSGLIENKSLDNIEDIKIGVDKSKTITLTYSPQVVGVDIAELRITYYVNKTVGETAEIVVKIKGEGAKTDLDVCILDDNNQEVKCQSNCPPVNGKIDFCLEKNFGEIDLNQEAIAKFSIKNKGGFPLNIIDSRVVQCPKSTPDCGFDSMVPSTSSNEYFMIEPSNGAFTGTLSEYPKGGHMVIVKVRYKALSGGVSHGALKVVSEDAVMNSVYVKLTAKGIAPKICVEPTNYSFPTTTVGQKSTGQIKILSCGTKELVINNIEFKNNVEGDFGYEGIGQALPANLSPGQFVFAKIFFQPKSCASTDSPDMAELKISANDPSLSNGVGVVRMYGDCQTAPECRIQLDPAFLDFGNILQNNSKELPFNVLNIGNADCDITSIGGLTNNKFSITKVVEENRIGQRTNINPPYAFKIPPGEKGIVTVRFQADNNLGTFTDTATVAHSAGNVKINMKATVIMKGQCQFIVTPSSALNFGNVAKGSCSTKSILMENKGADVCTINTVRKGQMTGSWFSLVKNYNGTKVDIGNFTKIETKCCPNGTGAAPSSMGVPDVFGTYNYLYINTDAANQPTRACTTETSPGWCIKLQCTGVNSRLDVLPNPIDFGIVTYGCNSQEIVVKLYNNGTAQLTVGPDISATPNPPFIITSKPAGATTIPPNSSIVVKIKYRPSIQRGVETGKLRIQTDAPNANNGYIEVPLRGEATPDKHVTDTFKQSDKPIVDVLWCIDNSGSMGNEQSMVAGNFPKFSSYATAKDPVTNEYKIDFNIGVITSEINDPERINGVMNYPGVLYAKSGYPKIIANYPPPPPRDPAFEPVTTDFNKAFAANATVGTCCSDESEACLEAMKMALSDPIISDPQGNKGFLRNTNTKFSKLALIVLTDEEDQSPASVDYYVDFFKQIKGVRNTDLLSASIICGLDRHGTIQNPPNAVACGDQQNSTGADAGKRYLDFWKKIGNGRAYSLCDTTWGDKLNELGIDIWTAQVEYYLSRPADPNTIQVTVNGNPVSRDPVNGYQYDPDHNSIYFGSNAVPPKGATIVVKYEAQCY
ncbi:MAG: choice-of-anchor D domain-containing protein [Deltaproteobacteria bacterium]|nr:choice-of-anchor D domain-containing protein [Deltaproteobacteria bacterium]